MPEKNPAKFIDKLRLNAGAEEVIPEGTFTQLEPATSYKLGTSTMAVDLTPSDWPLLGKGVVNTSRANVDFATQTFQPFGSSTIYQRRWDATPPIYSDDFTDSDGQLPSLGKWSLGTLGTKTIESNRLRLNSPGARVTSKFYFATDFDIEIMMDRNNLDTGVEFQLCNATTKDTDTGIDFNNEYGIYYSFGWKYFFDPSPVSLGSEQQIWWRWTRVGNLVSLYNKTSAGAAWSFLRSENLKAGMQNLYVRLRNSSSDGPVFFDDFVINQDPILTYVTPTDTILSSWSSWVQIKSAEDTLADITSISNSAVSVHESTFTHGGHVIQDNGTNKTQHSNLNFVGFNVTDDSGNDATVISAPTNLSGIVEVPEVAAKASFTPTVNNWTACTWTGYRWRIGNMLYMHIRGSVTGAPTGTVELVLPDSLALDTSIISVGEIPVFGEGFALDNGTGWKHFVCRISTGSPTKVLFVERGNGALSAFNATIPFTWANTDSLSFMLAVPISGWNNTKSINVGRIPAMYAAEIRSSSAQTGITPGTPQQILAGTTSYDDQGTMAVPASNALRVPPGCDRAIITLYVYANTSGASHFDYLTIRKNGSDFKILRVNINSSYVPIEITSGVVPVVAGDLMTGFITFQTTAGQVSEVKFSMVCWNSKSPRASAFKGALVKRSTGNQTISAGVYTAIQFAAEEYDTDNFHDNATNNTRLTIPSGVSRVRVSGSVKHSGAPAGTQITHIRKNGSNFVGQPAIRLTNCDVDVTMAITSPVVNVVAGDYFELFVYAASGATIQTAAETYFGIEVVE